LDFKWNWSKHLSEVIEGKLNMLKLFKEDGEAKKFWVYSNIRGRALSKTPFSTLFDGSKEHNSVIPGQFMDHSADYSELAMCTDPVIY
jgi:hypothetical protein